MIEIAERIEAARRRYAAALGTPNEATTRELLEYEIRRAKLRSVT